jgi:hypothetical protein
MTNQPNMNGRQYFTSPSTKAVIIFSVMHSLDGTR